MTVRRESNGIVVELSNDEDKLFTYICEASAKGAPMTRYQMAFSLGWTAEKTNQVLAVLVEKGLVGGK